MSYEHLLREAGSTCDDAGKFIDHALTCESCKRVLRMIGEIQLERKAFRHVLDHLTEATYVTKAN